jgi:hypothetical protein
MHKSPLLYPVVVLHDGMLQTSPLNKNFVPKFGVRCTGRILDGFSSPLLFSISSDAPIELDSTQSLLLCPFLFYRFLWEHLLEFLNSKFSQSLPPSGCLITTSPQSRVCIYLMINPSLLDSLSDTVFSRQSIQNSILF